MKRKQIFLLALTLVLLCAVFSACKKTTEQFNLTMNANDGSDASVVQVDKSTSYTLPTPTRDGYEFGGWYTKADFTGDAVTSVTVNADTAVYAKWDKLYTLTLDPAGGSLNVTSLRLKAGEKLADKLAAFLPEKADSKFGAWLLNGEVLTEDAVMGAENMTLTARYMVKYYVEIYVQNETMDGYDKQSEIIEDYAYADTVFTSARTLKGFTEVTKSDSVTRLVISNDAAQNRFRHYFDRASYTLTFVSNFPDGSANERKTAKIYYGVKTELPFIAFEMDGYILEGWAQSADGNMLYSSRLINVFGADAPAAPEITAENNITLYAVWSKGYTDLFGGSDIMYVSKGEKNTVYLRRGDIFFKGSLLQNKSIFFKDAPEAMGSGQLNADNKTFLYLDESRAEQTATLYEVGKGLNELIKITFSKDNKLTYYEKSSESDTQTKESTGLFYFTDDGYMIVTFDNGPRAGETMVFIVGTITINNEKKIAFQVRNEAEMNLGNILFFTVKDNEIVPNTDDNGNLVGNLTLDGFGYATYYGSNGQTTTFRYIYNAEKQTITLMDTNGQNSYTLKLMTINGELGYMIYNKAWDLNITLKDGSVLRVDGMRTATYEKDGVTVSGYFSVSSSYFGGTLLVFEGKEDGERYVFMITQTVKTMPIDPEKPDETEKVTETTAEKKSSVYAEYYYYGPYKQEGSDGNMQEGVGYFRAPLFVFEGPDYTTVTIYGYNENKEYHKIAFGTLVYHEDTKTYTLTVTEHYKLPEGAAPISTTPIDFSKIESCVLMLDNTTSKYNIHFWLSYTGEIGSTNLTVVYNGKDNATLTLVSGLAIYRVNGKTEIGTYQQNNNTLLVTFASRKLYFDLNDSDNSFESYDKTAETYYEVDKTGSVLKTKYLVYDPRTGTATYYVVTGEGEAQSVAKYIGTRVQTGKTSLTGFAVYRFTAEGMTFEYIQPSSLGSYMFIYDEAYAGEFTSTNTKGGVLILDGFGFAATYTDGDGLNAMGLYQKRDNEVSINGSTTYYFLLDGTTCKLRGEEYGKVFLLFDNQVFDGLYVTLDGIGGAKIFTVTSNGKDTETVFVDEAATYVKTGNNFTLTYNKNGAEEHTLRVTTGTFTSGKNTFNTLIVLHDEIVYSYVNESDWSVLRLHNDGTATNYLADGTVENGTYSLVTESLLYYVNSTGTSAYIYAYDKESGTATPNNYSEVAYYTKDLDSLLFTKYGFAVFNNSTKYYYTVDAEGNVTLYHMDENANDKNRYGYVTESFGPLANTKNYNDKVYFKNDGFAISFIREDGNKDLYPFPISADSKIPSARLSFAPNGADNFSVSGTVTIGDETYNCTVVKTKHEDGTVEMYFVVANFYYCYIDINYQGDGSGSENKSTYKVTGLSYINSMPSYTYLYYLYTIYNMFGASAAQSFTNEYGTIVMRVDYNEDGTVGDSYLDATFGKHAGYLQTDGELITKIEHAQLYPLGNNFYRVEFTGDDGYKYTMIFTYQAVSVFRTYGYNVYVLLREETVPANDGFEVTVTRVIASDANISAGAYFSFGLSKNGEKLTSDSMMLNDGKLFFVVRTKDEAGKITGTVYYQLDLVEKADGSLTPTEGEEGGDDIGNAEDTAKPLPVYVSATVTAITAETVYTADEKYFLDILPGNKILLMSEVTGEDDAGNPTRTLLLIAECNYDETTGVYTLKTSTDRTFTVTVTAGVATVTETTEAAS